MRKSSQRWKCPGGRVVSSPTHRPLFTCYHLIKRRELMRLQSHETQNRRVFFKICLPLLTNLWWVSSGSPGGSPAWGRPLGWPRATSQARSVSHGRKSSLYKYTLPQRVSCVFPGLLAILLLVSMKTNCHFRKHKLPSGPQTAVGVFSSRRRDLQTAGKIPAR